MAKIDISQIGIVTVEMFVSLLDINSCYIDIFEGFGNTLFSDFTMSKIKKLKYEYSHYIPVRVLKRRISQVFLDDNGTFMINVGEKLPD